MPRTGNVINWDRNDRRAMEISWFSLSADHPFYILNKTIAPNLSNSAIERR
jgi:hypothetical protein